MNKTEKLNQEFEIKNSVCRDDIIGGYGQRFALSLTDEEMEDIAETIRQGAMNVFWIDLEVAVESVQNDRIDKRKTKIMLKEA